jgi:YVTN family beta-propeller protein
LKSVHLQKRQISQPASTKNEHTNNVSVVDIKSLKEVALIPVGYAPARNTPWMARVVTRPRGLAKWRC